MNYKSDFNDAYIMMAMQTFLNKEPCFNKLYKLPLIILTYHLTLFSNINVFRCCIYRYYDIFYSSIILQHIILDLSTDCSFEYPKYFWLWCLTIFQHHEYLDSDTVLFYLSYTRRVGLYIYEDDLRHRFELVHANLWRKIVAQIHFIWRCF